MAPDEPIVRGVHLNWNVITMITSVVVITFSVIVWFNNQFSEFESRLDLKYATKQTVQAQRAKHYMDIITGLNNNMEAVHDTLVEYQVDDKAISSLRARMKELRSDRERYMQEFLDEIDD